ncbi:MAG: TRAP transporter small permease subunit [Betaproteobacteria bacterium]|nr:TRAP transporter small permease subunit [Betaproteobacteria bacterium]
MKRFIRGVDVLSKTVGHAFAWCIIILTFGTSYEVFVRYVLNNPTSWAFDFSYLMYGALFFMAGAYTLSRNGHVRGDFIYRMWPPRGQATIELVLYILFFFPGVLALMYSGWLYGVEAFRIREVSVNSPAGIPVWQLKLLIPFGAGLLALQGIAEVLRCILCIRDGQWPARLHDVEELEDVLVQQHAAGATGEKGGAK